MDRETLVEQVRQAIAHVEPNAHVILYGSRARGDVTRHSDWDFLVLLTGEVSDARADAIRHRLYEIEWESDEVISTLIVNAGEWESPRYRATPLHKAIEREGVPL